MIYHTQETVFHWDIQTSRRELKIRHDIVINFSGNFILFYSIFYFSFFYFLLYNLQGPTENRQSEWVPWINIVVLIIIIIIIIIVIIIIIIIIIIINSRCLDS